MAYFEKESFISMLESKAKMTIIGGVANGYYSAIKMLEALPSADVAEVKHGEWIYHPETFYTKSGFTCSVCKDPMWHSPDVKQAFKYCPHCGAKMDRKDDT